ncbi:hypothetical protein TRFO_30266 [Tritrichomonas foetus]|uniref:Right handed beta helix domain-containing protein n=1 Tax=Tritrichomonas foetus TaxID=1144522 RepID=A0A1J4JZ59_9EUKA|nr:hypothetical protein TRFO_30266 [Tritrichomonas foetus]|eukprot:OHT02541.1 hypothetical protein TRFO_30266 [Tritrichomonas foetus]
MKFQFISMSSKKSKKIYDELSNLKEELKEITINYDYIYNVNEQDDINLLYSNDFENHESLENLTNDLVEFQCPQFDFQEKTKLMDKLNERRNKVKEDFESVRQEKKQTDLEELERKRHEDPHFHKYNLVKFPTVNDQLKTLQDFDTLEIPRASYDQTLEINKPVHIVANPRAQFTSSAKKDCIKCNAYGAIVEGFEFIYRGNDPFSAAVIENGSVTFINCTFKGAKATTVATKNCSNATFINCSFSESNEFNISVQDFSTITCQKCTISNAAKSGIYLNGHSAANVVDTEIKLNSLFGVHIEGDSSALFQNCKIHTNSLDGFKIQSTSKNIMLRDNVIYNQDGFGIYVKDSFCSLSGNKIYDNSKGSLNIEKGSSSSHKPEVISNRNEYQCLTSSASLIKVGSDSILVSTSDKLEGKCPFGVFVESDAKYTAFNTKFENIEGQGIQIKSRADVYLDGCSFINVDTYNIAAMENSKVSVLRSQFVNDEDKIRGNKKIIGFLANKSINGLIEDCKFENLYNGIVLNESHDEITIRKCKLNNIFRFCVDIIDGSRALIEECCSDNNNITPQSIINIHSSKSTTDIENKPTFKKCVFTHAKISCANIENNASPIFEECTFEESKSRGAIAIRSSPIFRRCEFTNNEQAAVFVSEKAVVELEKCNIYANVITGLMVKDMGTKVIVKESKIYDHTASTGTTITENASATFENCQFYGNLMSHIESRMSASVKVIGCDIYSSGLGTGINVHSNGNLLIEKSKIHDEAKAAILAGTQGTIKVINCEIYNCSQSALFQKEMSHLSIIGCHIHNNTPDALTAVGGELIAHDNIFENQSAYAISISKEKVTHDLVNNKFNNNKVGDVRFF